MLTYIAQGEGSGGGEAPRRLGPRAALLPDSDSPVCLPLLPCGPEQAASTTGVQGHQSSLLQQACIRIPESPVPSFYSSQV